MPAPADAARRLVLYERQDGKVVRQFAGEPPTPFFSRFLRDSRRGRISRATFTPESPTSPDFYFKVQHVAEQVGALFPTSYEQNFVTREFMLYVSRQGLREHTVSSPKAIRIARHTDDTYAKDLERHTQEARRMAQELAVQYGADEEKIYTWLESANIAGMKLAGLFVGKGRTGDLEEDFYQIIEDVNTARKATGLWPETDRASMEQGHGEQKTLESPRIVDEN